MSPTDKVLWRDDLVWVGPADRPAEIDATLDLVTFGPNCFYRPVIEEVLGRLGMPFRTILEWVSLAGVRAAVAAGLGLSVLNRRNLAPGIVELTQLGAIASLPRIFYVLRSRSPRPDGIERALVAQISEAIGA